MAKKQKQKNPILQHIEKSIKTLLEEAETVLENQFISSVTIERKATLRNNKKIFTIDKITIETQDYDITERDELLEQEEEAEDEEE